MKNIKLKCLAVLLLVSCMSCLAAAPTTPFGEPHIYKTVDGHALTLYVNAPAKHASPMAAVVFFHGGAWTRGTPDAFNSQSAALAQHGAVGIQVQYRLLSKSDDGNTVSPQICVEDAKSAIRWVRAHATELNIDPDKIVASGGSAGGYMAAYTGLIPGWEAADDPAGVSSVPDAMVLYNPVIDNSTQGYGRQRFGDDYKAHSPIYFASKAAPPMLILSGSEDIHIHPDALRLFQQQLQSAGARCDLVIYPGQEHGFFKNEPYQEQTTQEMLKFLTSLGYLSN